MTTPWAAAVLRVLRRLQPRRPATARAAPPGARRAAPPPRPLVHAAAGPYLCGRVIPPAVAVTDAAALDAIQHMLRDPDWGVGMLEDIAQIVSSTGRTTGNYPDDRPTWARH